MDLEAIMSRQGSTLIAIAIVAGLSWAESRVARGGEYYLTEARLGTRTAPLLLLSRSDVRADLNLSQEQSASAEAMIDSVYTRAEKLRGKPNSPEVIAERRVIDESQKEWLATKLSVDQQRRLIQLDLQWEGPTSLVTRQILAETLGLSAEQLKTLIQANSECRRIQASGDAAAIQKAERSMAQTTLATLNDEQKLRWKAMLGKPFTVQTASSRPKTAR
jgi:hypothetical protein